jgi:ABC-type lipoprotein export system ATPase subunit
LRRINQEDRCTIVMVTHSPEAAKIGDRTILLRDGLIEKDF